ncbi:MAG: bifunctional UDP-N-acetylmuramoyl-tripeptide:D-alanyl-D-alanine ligase/alanine racemase [Bacteroidales bacterium]|nr:bifunctional UDP-N-acetylmuramoyl-tripeptide:D-alanyl-D-alanine ligase/alanine racemase [Bacteroidales bacterium]
MFASDISDLVKAIKSQVRQPEAIISKLLTDSRSLTSAEVTLFFAIATKRNSGSRYVKELYEKGVRNFIVPSDTAAFGQMEDANIWYVQDVVRALQQVAAAHRSLYDIPVVGITGSNGKTIVKDWIVQLLSNDLRVVASPKSYNSQIGVPLSVWQMKQDDELAVFEVGISEAGEMEKLRNVVKPTIGIFTNVGQAHDENFLSRSQKVAEKMHLFTHCKALIYCSDHHEIHSMASEKEAMRNVHRYTWGCGESNAVRLVRTDVGAHTTTLFVTHEGQEQAIEIPFIDRASAENAMHCITLLYYLGVPGKEIAHRCLNLTPVAMRLEMNEGVNDCLLVNDSYSLDLNSLSIALDFVQHETQHPNKTLIMSDILQSGMPDHELYDQVCGYIKNRGISKFIGIGDALYDNRERFTAVPRTYFYHDTEEFIHHHNLDDFQNETILLKGARVFQFENIAKLLQRKSHETVLEVNLGNLVCNLNYYRSLIQPSTKLMAMVKASSYGAGKVEIANTLQYNHVDYLTVAYSDEGVELRRNGILLPIMVMNPEEDSFDDIIRFGLEPDIYSMRIFHAFNETARLFLRHGEKVPVHVELDTGMHRLGFMEQELDNVARAFSEKNCVLRVQSIFTHFACADDPAMDNFTRGQIRKFQTWSSRLKERLGDDGILCHICNSSGIARFPEAHMDMVRLGIGLYGVAPEPNVQARLAPVSRLKTKISQVKEIPCGDSVGYNRRWVAPRDSRIAIIPIGYADGLSRHLGYGNGRVEINGKEAPIIGSICMDMCFIDVTDVACKEGDEAIIFGSERLLKQMAAAAGTITYEILTTVAPRVKRIYFQE